MKFREMRKIERQMTDAQAEEVLRSQDHGVLSVHGDDGYPYGVPVNYGYADGKLYIHCTAEGSHKVDAIRRNNKVSMCVLSRYKLLREVFSSQYTSVIVFGTAKILDDEEGKREALYKMMLHLAPELAEKAVTACSRRKDLLMIEITPQHITGKTNR